MIQRELIDETYTVGGKDVIVRREDLAYPEAFPRSGKVTALEAIVEKLAERKVAHVSMYAKDVTTYAPALEVLCRERAMKTTIFFAANDMKKTPLWLQAMQQETTAEIILLRPNMITINVNQAKKQSAELGAYFIPFGLDCKTAVDAFSKTLTFPRSTRSLVLSTCSGITLAGFIRGLRQRKQKIPRIVAVSCGRSAKQIKASVEKYEALPATLEIVDSYAMHENLKHVAPPFECHEIYELKAFDWLEKNVASLESPIRFLNLGV